MEEVGDELGTPVRGDVGGNSVLGKHSKRKVRDIKFVTASGNEYGLLGKAVDDYEDCGISAGRGLFDEVHGNGVPGLFRDWKLLEHSIGAVSRGFSSGAGGAGTDIVFDKGAESWPSVFPADELVLEDVKTKVLSFWDKDMIVERQETVGVDSPLGVRQVRKMKGSYRVRGQGI
ncbi:hypothetical protein BS17DRAFT_759995 [Gyrodon lividus]|nr:hypothetical protein BS17DRAFT_759995 [Gyrodon lividus]